MMLLHVTASMDPKSGGVSQALRTMVAGLSERGIRNEVVSLDAPDAQWCSDDLLVIHAVGPSRNPWRYSALLLPWLLDNLPRFDAVILHGLWLYNGYAIRKGLRHLKTHRPATGTKNNRLPRFFVMPHGMLDPYFQQATGRKLKAWRNHLYWRLVEGSVINESDGLLFTCETERLLACQSFAPYHPRREVVVGLGVETPPTYTSAMRAAFLDVCPSLRERSYLLFLSRIHDKKGVELLIQAYAQMYQHQKASLSLTLDHSFTEQSAAVHQALPALVIAGPGLETSYGQRMLDLAADLPEGTIYFPGMLSGEAKWGAFYGCEAFVLPSHQENFGIAVVEAMACGKPVLISNQINIWREIAASGGGLIADDTSTGTHYLLESWLNMSALQKQTMGEHAQKTYFNCFATGPSAEKMAASLK